MTSLSNRGFLTRANASGSNQNGDAANEEHGPEQTSGHGRVSDSYTKSRFCAKLLDLTEKLSQDSKFKETGRLTPDEVRRQRNAKRILHF